MNGKDDSTQERIEVSSSDHLQADGGTLYIAGGANGSGSARRLHPDRECRHLRAASSVREATPAEVATHEHCGRCAGEMK
ncbi:MAG: hypothetical protein ABEH77_04100 [Halobacteriaceae archaeon]